MAIFIGLLFSVETVLWFALPIPELPKQSLNTKPDKDLGWVFTGCERRTDDTGVSYNLCFNSWGLRGISEPPLEGEWIFLGDSVTAGLHVPEEATFAALFGALNAGFDGYSTYQERDRYKRDLYRIRTKNLVLFVCPNDVTDEKINQQMIEETLLVNRSIARRSWKSYIGMLRLYRYLKTLRYRDFENPQVKDRYYFDAVAMERTARLWNEWTHAVLDIRDAAGPVTRFHVVLMPPRSVIKKFKEGRRNLWLNDNLKTFCEKNGIRFIDPVTDFAQFHEVDSLFLDSVHFSKRGHKVVSEILMRYLR